MFRRIMSMVGRRHLVAAKPAIHVPTRTWAQVGIIISTPARQKVSGGEMLVHIAFMMVVWLAPVFYFLTQLKVWRRLYVEN